MIDLLLGIVFFTIILFFFKILSRFKVNNLQAIIVNYLVAGGLGVYMYETPISIKEVIQLDWIYFAVLIGLFFVVVFKLLADGAQKVGIALSTLANKMSVIFPIIASFLLFGDTVTLYKVLGIILALIGVILSGIQKGKLSFDPKYLGLIIIIFVGQGVADILFNYAQVNYVTDVQAPLFISVIFLSAFCIGILILSTRLIQKKEKLQAKSILWGIAIGIPNYLTVYYFFRSLNSGIMESSQVYPVLNIGVIILSALLGFVIFKEKLSLSNWFGIGICVLAIFLIIL